MHVVVTPSGLRQDAAAYAARFGITEADGLSRLQTLPKLAEALAALESAVPARFAGGWIEHEPSLAVAVRFTGGDVGLDVAAQILARVDVPVDTRFGAEYTLVELNDGLHAIAPMIDTDYPNTGMFVEVETGSVSLLGPDEISQAALEVLSASAGVPVTAQKAGRVELHHTYGGHRIDAQLLCTTGFSTVDAVHGTTGVLTAGHCAGVHNSIAQYHDVDGSTYNANMTGKRWDSNQDFSWYQTAHVEYPQFFMGFGYRNVSGTILRTQMAGNWVCHYGRTTGHSCGVIDTIRYRPSSDVCNNTPCSDRWPAIINDPSIECFDGDSGGPYFVGTIAWGTHTAGNAWGPESGQCSLALLMSAEQLTWDGVNTRIMLAN